MGNERTVDMLVCSVCRAEFSFDYETGVGAEHWNFCPNCGAKMKQEAQDDGKNKMAQLAELFDK